MSWRAALSQTAAMPARITSVWRRETLPRPNPRPSESALRLMQIDCSKGGFVQSFNTQSEFRTTMDGTAQL
jgi:hypothetical protein